MTLTAANGNEAVLVDLTRQVYGDAAADSLDIQLQQARKRQERT